MIYMRYIYICCNPTNVLGSLISAAHHNRQTAACRSFHHRQVHFKVHDGEVGSLVTADDVLRPLGLGFLARLHSGDSSVRTSLLRAHVAIPLELWRNMTILKLKRGRARVRGRALRAEQRPVVQVLCMMGPSGAGKSTILLLGKH